MRECMSDTLQCNTCRCYLPVTDFSISGRKVSTCRECIASINKKSYEDKRQLVRAAKNVPCMDCGVRYPCYVMDMDHVRGKKEFDLGLATWHAIQAVRDEIPKCDVVCANCHRERTYQKKLYCYRRSTPNGGSWNKQQSVDAPTLFDSVQ